MGPCPGQDFEEAGAACKVMGHGSGSCLARDGHRGHGRRDGGGEAIGPAWRFGRIAVRASAGARSERQGLHRVETKAFGRLLLAPQPFVAGTLTGCLPFGDLDFDRGHFVPEPVASEDMGIGERGIVIVEGIGQIIGAKPLAMIFDEIGRMIPFARGVALPAADREPPFAAIFDVHRTERLDITVKHVMLIAIGEHRDEGFGIAVAALIMRAEDRVIGEAIVAPFFRRAVAEIHILVRRRFAVAPRAVPASVAQPVGILGRDLTMTDDEIFAVVGEVIAGIDIGNDETAAVDETPDACAIEAALGVSRCAD